MSKLQQSIKNGINGVTPIVDGPPKQAWEDLDKLYNEISSNLLKFLGAIKYTLEDPTVAAIMSKYKDDGNKLVTMINLDAEAISDKLVKLKERHAGKKGLVLGPGRTDFEDIFFDYSQVAASILTDLSNNSTSLETFITLKASEMEISKEEENNKAGAPKDE